MVDEITSVLDPLLDFIFGFVKDGIHAFADSLDILVRDIEHRLEAVWWDCEGCRDESSKGQEREFHPR